MSPHRLVALAVCGAVSLAACSGGDETSDDVAVTAVEPTDVDADEEAASATTQPTSTASSTTTTAATTTAAATTSTVATAGPLSGVDGVAAITVLNPPTGNGARPLLRWEPVDGAADYVVILTTRDGQGYWAWSGPSTEVWLGGTTDEPRPASEGPTLFEPMTLLVVARDADGGPVGSSDPVPIAP